MPCLSSSADKDLKDSIRVSNAESQLALPLRTTTVFGSSEICSPKGSAGCTGGGGMGGVSAAAGGLAGGAEGLPGVCASALPRHKEIAIGISATWTRRNERRQFIGYSPKPWSAVASAWC